MTPFNHETRLIKQVEAVVSGNRNLTCHILALNDGKSVEEETIGKYIFVRRLSLRTIGLPKHSIFQILKGLEFTLLILFYAVKNKTRVVTIHGLILLPIAALIKFLCSAKIIYDAHELETETTSLCGWRKKIYKITERTFIRFASHVFVASPSIGAWYEEQYRLGDRISVLMNIHKRKTSIGAGQLHKSLKIHRSKEIILYQGALINGRGIEKLIEAFNGLDNQKYVLVFMGYGSFEEKIIEASKNNQKIYHHPAVPQSVLSDYTKSAFCGICFVNNGSLNDDLCLPNKFFEYLYAGVPAIVSRTPDMQHIIEKYNLGVVVDQLDKNTLEASLDEVIKLKNSSFNMRVSNLNKEYNWDIQELSILNVYKKLMA